MRPEDALTAKLSSPDVWLFLNIFCYCEVNVFINIFDHPKSIRSSDLAPNLLCWEACPVMAWSANTKRKTPEQSFLKVSLEFVENR